MYSIGIFRVGSMAGSADWVSMGLGLRVSKGENIISGRFIALFKAVAEPG
jgi:hypothetical protein